MWPGIVEPIKVRLNNWYFPLERRFSSLISTLATFDKLNGFCHSTGQAKLP
jgi:hypothetical protein